MAKHVFHRDEFRFNELPEPGQPYTRNGEAGFVEYVDAVSCVDDQGQLSWQITVAYGMGGEEPTIVQG